MYLKNGEKKEKRILLKVFVLYVQKNLLTLLLMLLNTVALVVALSFTARKNVYNLQVADCPEYFANNILVHNCMMSLALSVWDLPVRPITNRSMTHVEQTQGVTPYYSEWGI
jgi:hypothetical protein